MTSTSVKLCHRASALWTVKPDSTVFIDHTELDALVQGPSELSRSQFLRLLL